MVARGISRKIIGGTMNKHILFDGIKSSLLWDEDTDAWVYYSGEPVRDNTPRIYYQLIPTLFRAVDMRASAIANLPWALMKGETEFETSKDYENKTGLVSNMNVMLYLIEASLVLAGSAYWKRETNPAGFDKLRHLDPTSMQLNEKKAQKGEIEWKRNENSVTKTYTPEEIIYFWSPDPFVEIGPPSSWPAKTALTACGVLANMDEFARNYFGRGAIKAMLFSMTGASQTTATEFESWWNRYITGIKNAFRTKVINAESVTPVVVGEGIQELAEVTLSQEKREEVAIACDVKMSLLFADAANYATANQDKRNWYEDMVIPESKFIASILNEQLFDEMGLRFVFNAESLDIMQKEEKERSMSLGYLVNAGMPLVMALDVLGFELTKKQLAELEALQKEKEEVAEQMQEQLQGGGNGDGVAFQPEDPKEKPDTFRDKKSVDTAQLQRELSIWQTKCLSAVKRGESASSVSFIPFHIPTKNYDWIVGALEDDTDVEDTEAIQYVKDVFASAFRDETPKLDAKTGMQADISLWMRKAVDALESGELSELDQVTSEFIPPTLASAISGSLEEATTEDEIAQVFADIWLGYP